MCRLAKLNTRLRSPQLHTTPQLYVTVLVAITTSRHELAIMLHTEGQTSYDASHLQKVDLLRLRGCAATQKNIPYEVLSRIYSLSRPWRPVDLWWWQIG